MDFMKNTHEDCVNFESGRCKVYHFTNLDPKGSACPHFKAKEKKPTTPAIATKTIKTATTRYFIQLLVDELEGGGGGG
jgi:hypothetical protein